MLSHRNLREGDSISRKLPEGALAGIKATEVGGGQFSRPRRYEAKTYRLVKRTIDVLASLSLLLLLFPLFVLILMLIALVDGFPATFKSARYGRNGERFYAYKFRTMVKNADEVLKADPVLYAEYLQTFKLKNDPRVTGIGKILRATSMDEFPQLINVLKGEMSLVGPRPILISEGSRLDDPEDPIARMLPGCAGLWQCSGRADTSYADRIRLDKQYYEHASLRLDTWILLRTAWSILKREGAC